MQDSRELAKSLYSITNSKNEAKSLVSYLKTSFADKLLSIRKIKNHITKDNLKWIPNVPLDRLWTNEELFKYFKLTKQEQKLFI